MYPEWTSEGWRRERDSNPRYPFGYNGFQDRRHQPLGHPSGPGVCDANLHYRTRSWSTLILDASVVGFIPSRRAAPFGPKTRPPV